MHAMRSLPYTWALFKLKCKMFNYLTHLKNACEKIKLIFTELKHVKQQLGEYHSLTTACDIIF